MVVTAIDLDRISQADCIDNQKKDQGMKVNVKFKLENKKLTVSKDLIKIIFSFTVYFLYFKIY